MDVASTGIACTKCKVSSDNVELIRLWDGRDYCTRCLEQANPQLLDYARSQPILEESLKLEKKKFAEFFMWIYVLFFIGLALFLAVYNY